MLGGAREIALRSERVAEQDRGLGCAGIGRCKPARAVERFAAKSAGKQRGDEPDLQRAIVGVTRRGGPRRREFVVGKGIEGGEGRTLRHRGAGEIAGRASRVAGPRERLADQGQRVAVGIGEIGDRPQGGHRPRRIPGSPPCEREQAAGLAVGGLEVDEPGEAVRRLAIIAEAEIDHAGEQLARRRALERAVGARVKIACQCPIAGAGSEHGLEVISGGIAAGQLVRLACIRQHVTHPPHVAIGRRAAEHGGEIVTIDFQRPIEPGQGRREAILATRQLAPKHQGVGVAWT